jgi:Tachylectin
MAARLVQVTLVNHSSFPIRWLDDHREHGFWQEPWYPSNLKDLEPGQQGTWRLESGGVMTGVEGSAVFTVDIPPKSNVPPRTEFIDLSWERPYLEPAFRHDVVVRRLDPPGGDLNLLGPDLVFYREAISSTFGGLSDIFAGMVTIPPVGPILGMANEKIGTQIAWAVEILDTPAVSPPAALRLETPGVVYAVEPMVQANVQIEGQAPPPSGGNLRWYRHTGREDGSFTWEGPKKVGSGWGHFSQVFSGGDGIIYAVRNNGDLLWYQHTGREDGSFTWEGPKKVGSGWGHFSQVFSGGDGIIYAVEVMVQPNVHRHAGREDGSPTWEGPKKVGAGWAALTHVFPGDGDIIYGVQDNGDLLWYRHGGRPGGESSWATPRKVGTGWELFTHLFSG